MRHKVGMVLNYYMGCVLAFVQNDKSTLLLLFSPYGVDTLTFSIDFVLYK